MTAEPACMWAEPGLHVGRGGLHVGRAGLHVGGGAGDTGIAGLPHCPASLLPGGQDLR